MGSDRRSVLRAALQVASHLISGLSTAVEACARASSVSYGSHSIGPPSRVAVAKAAYTVSLASCSSLQRQKGSRLLLSYVLRTALT